MFFVQTSVPIRLPVVVILSNLYVLVTSSSDEGAKFAFGATSRQDIGCSDCEFLALWVSQDDGMKRCTRSRLQRHQRRICDVGKVMMDSLNKVSSRGCF